MQSQASKHPESDSSQTGSTTISGPDSNTQTHSSAETAPPPMPRQNLIPVRKPLLPTDSSAPWSFGSSDARDRIGPWCRAVKFQQSIQRNTRSSALLFHRVHADNSLPLTESWVHTDKNSDFPARTGFAATRPVYGRCEKK